ncbi:FliA/WhiG family RNA polymerase sigma factor [Soehngenia longivitae]|uniref:RNA polymerase sigma factor n=1 Tax=Soehngenia longivitae TaxID=2562294 RepID=A0A4Z0D3J5_9FIRM|nr:FliA/WhiG family RNA polymerase sigma factor [Soehngenia longivitae]TFZ39938.1 FliA/WhiG family RNA polymerase sigma factor [Soehngenia longivitae]
MSQTYLNNKDDLIIKYIPLVNKIVSRIEINDNALDYEDLVSVGIIGLMDAIDKFDNTKNVPFEAYATIRIRGAIIDELRKSGKVSRDRIYKLNEYYAAKEKLEKELNRTPEEQEIIKELNLETKELSKIYETLHYLSNVSLESVIYTKSGEEFNFIDTLKDDKEKSPEEKYIDKERKKELKKAIEKLNEREQQILSLYYVEELTLKEIAYVLDISIARVSQIHGKILLKLNSSIKDLMEDEDV